MFPLKYVTTVLKLSVILIIMFTKNLDFLITYVHLLLVPKPSDVAIVIASLRAIIKLELAVNLGSISGSVASLGSEF